MQIECWYTFYYFGVKSLAHFYLYNPSAAICLFVTQPLRCINGLLFYFLWKFLLPILRIFLIHMIELLIAFNSIPQLIIYAILWGGSKFDYVWVWLSVPRYVLFGLIHQIVSWIFQLPFFCSPCNAHGSERHTTYKGYQWLLCMIFSLWYEKDLS